MIQGKIQLDPFEHVLDNVIGMAEYSAYRSMQEIRAMAETHRRSIGQRSRRFLEKIGVES
jgi:hypothetical protein